MTNLAGRALRPLASFALAAALAAPLGASAQTPPSDMLGTWTAPAGGAVKTVVIAAAGSGYTIHVSAPCTPTPCDWGTRPLTIYAPSASSTIGKVGSATYNQGFVTRTVIVTLQDATAPFLRVDVYSKFAASGSGGRSNYVSTQTLH